MVRYRPYKIRKIHKFIVCKKRTSNNFLLIYYINHFEKQKYEIISLSLLVAEHEGQLRQNEGETIDIDGSEGIVKKLCKL